MIIKLDKVIVDPKIEVKIGNDEDPVAVYVNDRIAMWLTIQEANKLMNELRMKLNEVGGE